MHIRVDEKISLKAGKDGGLQEMEVRGMILLRISDAEYANIAIAVENNDTRGFRFQVYIKYFFNLTKNHDDDMYRWGTMYSNSSNSHTGIVCNCCNVRYL